ncbi:hypothetical protein SBADM41S_04515 [Streptomyces badius]
MAASVLVAAVGNSATSTLVGLGHSKLVMRAGTTGTAAAVVLSLTLVNGIGSFDGFGLVGAGIAMLASSLISASVAHWGLRRQFWPVGRSTPAGRTPGR